MKSLPSTVGKGSSVTKDLDILPISLPPHTTIRFDNSVQKEESNSKEREKEGSKKSATDADYSFKKLEIKTNLEKIESQLKVYEKRSPNEGKCQELSVVKSEEVKEQVKEAETSESKEISNYNHDTKETKDSMVIENCQLNEIGQF